MGSMRDDGSAGTGVLHRFGNATRMMRTSVPVPPPSHPSRSTQSDTLLAQPLSGSARGLRAPAPPRGGGGLGGRARTPRTRGRRSLALRLSLGLDLALLLQLRLAGPCVAPELLELLGVLVRL